MSTKKGIQLDLKDKKILYELDFHARQPYSEIAKKVGLSKQVVEYRINNLINRGIIQRFYPVISMPKLGYTYCRLAITLQNINREEFNEILDDLKKDPRVFWLFEMQGSFDLMLALWTNQLNDFRKYSEEFMAKYARFVKKKTEHIATDVIHYQNRYLLGKNATEDIHLAETSIRSQIDELDKSILSLLCDDARMSLVDLGQRTKQSAKTVAYRIRRMERIRLIECYRASIDHTKLGFTYYKLMVNISNFNSQELKRIKEYIKNNPHTIYIVEGISLHADLDFEMMIKSNQDLFDFIKNLREQFPRIVGDYSTIIFMHEHKVKYLPF